MISQSLYQKIHDLLRDYQFDCTPALDVEFNGFLRPYVLVIHQPSGRGFYLNREYRHIIDVDRCQEPKNPVETEKHHLCASTNLPSWVHTEVAGKDEFDSFWLY